MQRVYLKKLNNAGKEQYQVKIWNRCTAFKNLDDVDDNRAWENIRDNTKISAEENLGRYKLKQHKSWFDD
jgi:hypothetical protein